jgi:hypothetical protein
MYGEGHQVPLHPQQHQLCRKGRVGATLGATPAAICEASPGLACPQLGYSMSRRTLDPRQTLVCKISGIRRPMRLRNLLLRALAL